MPGVSFFVLVNNVFMSVIKCVIIGAVQGLTEFLPVSSSGHILLAQKLLGVSADSVTLALALHLGTLAAVLTVFWGRFVSLFRPPFKNLGLLALATIPAAIAGLVMESFWEGAFGGQYLWAGFLTTAVLLFAAQKVMKKNYDGKITARRAVVMGLAQAAALLPGLSRSGATISAGVFAKGDKKEAAAFSFLMSVPIVAGACALRLLRGGVSYGDPAALIAGFASSAVFGFVAIKVVLKLVGSNNFLPFCVYLVVIAVVSLFVA